jgi:hypothetical protein
MGCPGRDAAAHSFEAGRVEVGAAAGDRRERVAGIGGWG